jgi:hypothetical protein
VLKSEPPESKYYVLTSLGKGQLRLLLEQVERNELKANQPKMKARTANVWNRTYIGKGCHRDPDTVAKILKAVDPGAKPGGLGDRVREDVMLALFRWLYARTGRDLAGKYGEGITDDLLREQKYWEPPKQKVVEGRTPKETAELLRCLDASSQRDGFELALAEAIGGQKHFAVGVAVPCVWSQRWLIDCLINTPKYLENLRSVKIQLSEKCFEMADVKQEVLEGLNCRDEDHLLKKLQNGNRPLIISLYDFGQTSAVKPKDVVSDFWVPLQKKLEQRKVSSQIILLMADYNLASEAMEGVTLLPALSSISETDLRMWMVRTMGNSHCVSTFLKDGFPPKDWLWDEPRTILNRVCKDFLGLKGLVDLHTTWRLS